MFKLTKIKIYLLFLCVFLVHLLLLVNTLFTLWPEMIVYPYLFNNGFLLYRDIINPYPPALTIALAQFGKMFGYHPPAYQILTWIIILIIDILVFTIAVKLFKKISYGFLSILFFTLFSILFGVNGLWFELIQTPFILVSFFYFYKFKENKIFLHLFISFLFLTFAIFIKQQAAWLAIWFIVVLFADMKISIKKYSPKIYLALLPALALLLIHLLLFYKLGTLQEFLYLNIGFPLLETSKSVGYILLPTNRQALVVITLFLAFLPIFFSNKSKLKFIVLTSAYLLIFSYPRFDYFHLIPALAILSLAFGSLIKNKFGKNLKLKTIAITSIIILTSFNIRYLIINWGSDVRFFEPEILIAAKLVSLVTTKADRIYVQNGPDQLLPLSQRIPIKPWAIQFPWYMEKTNLQERTIKGFQNEEPNYVIFQPYSEGYKYDLGSYRPEIIFDYLEQNYKTELQISNSLWLKTRIQ